MFKILLVVAIMIDIFLFLDAVLNRFYFWSNICLYIMNIGLMFALIIAIFGSLRGSYRAFRSISSLVILLGQRQHSLNSSPRRPRRMSRQEV